MDVTAGGGDLVERLAELGARHLWVVYHNYSALAQAKSVPPVRFREAAREGVSFARANWDFAITDEQLPHPGFGADSGDFRVVPDPATLVSLAHRAGVAQAYGWIVDDDGPWSGDPRARLRDQVERLAAHGFSARMAYEAEFILLERLPGGGLAPADHGRMFTIDEVEARWAWSAGVLDALEATGVAVHQLAREYGPGQYEVSLLPGAPVQATDRFLLMRQVVRALARDDGRVASFMPKPRTELAGNGLHVHLSLVGPDGSDALPDPASDGLTPTGEHAIAGLLEHADGLAALAAPTPNSYRRLRPGSWAPAHRCWGFGNRAALVRVPGRGQGRHLEFRLADASANPYLLATGLLAAIVDGLERRIRLPPAVEVDVGHMSDAEAAALGASRLPTDAEQAVAALTSDAVLLAALGPVIAEHYPAMKRFEAALCRAAAPAPGDPSAVTDWERHAYLEHV
jgi:glutamine synthetase